VTWLRSLIDLVRRSITLFVEFDGIDRSMGLAAQAFTAIFPLIIVLSGILQGSNGDSFGEVLVRKFDLGGDAADAARRAFPDTGHLVQSVTFFSVVILLISALSFARALQRLYEHVWNLQARGMRDTPYGLAWLACVCAYVSLHPVLHDLLPHWARLPASVAGGVLVWLGTPWLVLGRRIHWRRLFPQAILTAFAMGVLLLGSEIYLPRATASAASQFGTIGFAFTLVSWLFGGAIVVAGTAALGRCAIDAPRRAWQTPQAGMARR
jgi:membrane protein